MYTHKYRESLVVALAFTMLMLAGIVHAQSLDQIVNEQLNRNTSQTGKSSNSRSDQAQSLDEILSEQLNRNAPQSGEQPNLSLNTDLGAGLEDRFQELALLTEFEIPKDTQFKNLPGNEKIAANLRALMAQKKSLDPFGFQQKAFELGVEIKQNLVYVTIATESELESKAMESDIREGFMSQFRNNTYALVPLSELEGLAAKNGVYSIQAQQKDYPFADSKGRKIVSEGVKSVNVSHLHGANITGKKVKIGIIDFGFHRYAELLKQGEVPTPIATKTFNNSGQSENGNVHGTACAEIIHDMAPDAELYLAVIDGLEGQLVNAAEWLAQQGVDIISFSGGGHGGPHNGTGTQDQLVESITEKHGILWVNAAGNEGDKHLPLNLEDKDGNQLIDIELNGKQVDYAIVEFRRPGSVLMIWDDWGKDPLKPSSTQDLDLYLKIVDPRTQKVVKTLSSENPQNGRAVPGEILKISKEDVPLVGGLVVVKRSATRPVPIHIHIRGGAILPSSPAGSIGIPATSRKALAVGAVNVQKLQLEAFSSQGPTDDGRLKPDVSAPDFNLSVAYGKQPGQPGRFPGTSAACPHVSGFAALLKQHFSPSSPDELRRLVETNVRFLGSQEPNNQYGRGYITAQAIQVGGPSTGGANDKPSPGGKIGDLQRTLDDILGR